MPPRPSLAVSQPTRATANFTQRFTVTWEPHKTANVMIDSDRPGPCRTHFVAGSNLRALFREDKLRDETPVSQAALKVVPAQREVVELHYRRPSCFFLSEAGWGEIDLLKAPPTIRSAQNSNTGPARPSPEVKARF